MVVRELITRLGFDPNMAGIRKADSAVTRFSNRVGTIGKKMSMMVTLPLIGLGTAALKASMDINKSMANVATLIPGDIERIKSLKRTVQDLAIDYGKSTTDIAGGLYQVISAFGDAADTEKKLEVNAMAAVAGLSTVTDAINLTSAVTKAYGDTSAEAVGKVSDLAFQTVKLGQTTFPELAAEIMDVTGLSSTLGVKIEELFGLFATLTGVTGNTNMVSTQFAAILRAMIRPTDNMKQAIKKLGYEGAKEMVVSRGIVGALKDLIGTTDGSEEAVGKLFGEAEALKAVFPLISTQAGTFTFKLKEMQSAAGATETAFKEQTEGINKFGHEFEQTKQRIAVAAQDLGDALAEKGVFGRIGEQVERFTTAVREADPETLKFFTDLGLVLIAIGPGLTILAKAVTTLEKLIPVFKWGAAFFAAALPFADYFEWKKGEVSVLRDLFGEYPGPFSKQNLADKANEFIKGLNTLFTIGLNYLGLPEPIPYFGVLPEESWMAWGGKRYTMPAGGATFTIENFTVTVPEGTPETMAERVSKETERAVEEAWRRVLRDVERNTPNVE